jgi:nucleoside-diphosphate-sugar epimerase
MENLFNRIYKDRVVLVTGHTGFKGSWLVYWLAQMGAKVIGYSLEAPTNPNHIELLKLNVDSIIGDIRDQETLNKTFENYNPDIVFHLAAQPLVRYSYTDPVNTYETNVIGTLKVFEACKKHNVKDHWNNFEYEFNKELNQPHEARLLKLDCTKANKLLSWHMVWDSKKTFEKTVKWYKSFYEKQKVLTNFHLQDYIDDAHSKGLSWRSN